MIDFGLKMQRKTIFSFVFSSLIYSYLWLRLRYSHSGIKIKIIHFLFCIFFAYAYLWLRLRYSRSTKRRITSSHALIFEPSRKIFSRLKTHSIKINKFIWLCPRLCVPLNKVLSLGNTKKNKFSFGISLAYSYLCHRLWWDKS